MTPTPDKTLEAKMTPSENQRALEALDLADECFQPETLDELRTHFPMMRKALSRDVGWQTMDSAPKDGTIIDVWLEEADEEELNFYCTRGTRRSANWHYLDGKFRPYLGLFKAAVFIQPSHWTPMLPPPTDKTTDRGDG